MQKEYINEKDAARFLGLCVQTLRNWRGLGKGPKYAKIGRCVRYQLSDLKAYAEARTTNPEGGGHHA